MQTAYIYIGIMALDAFVYMAALDSTGGPGNSTLVMSQYLFHTAFEKGQLGLSSAMGVVLAVIHAAVRRRGVHGQPLHRRLGQRRPLMSDRTSNLITIDKKAARRIAGARTVRTTSGDKVVGGISHVVLVWSIIVIVPLLWTLMSSFKTSREVLASPFGLPAEWNLDNYISAWTQYKFGQMFVNTVIVVGVSVVLVMVLGHVRLRAGAVRAPGNRVIY